MLEKVGQGQVRVGDACSKGLQELKAERLTLVYVQARGFGAGRVQCSMSDVG